MFQKNDNLHCLHELFFPLNLQFESDYGELHSKGASCGTCSEINRSLIEELRYCFQVTICYIIVF